ncbi:ATP-dependent DNA ligase [Streptomyces sp. Tu102]|uniref:ATP-dependent DNA ligase n=1 Tax=Streptomyces TaxID=1883 RepID=UPI001BDC2143|nr:ATP-dependent DNA ligase [Streptomyces sp. Tu102]MBT1094213.1 ATP-dependent DNA ligase [Streptomyces sp. Tu102]
MTWTLPEPILTTPTPHAGLRPGWAAEPKWDGFRAQLAVEAGSVTLRSRRGTDMAAAFPEITAEGAQLPDKTALDGELVVWAQGRLAFERLQDRLHRRGPGAARAADAWPAHFVAFDLLRLSGTLTTSWPYHRRRAALEAVFAGRRLSAPWTLCPSTTDPEQVAEWLTWGSIGMEGVIYKRLSDPYRPAMRGWLKYKPRETTEAIVGAVTGPLAAPRTLLLGRYDTAGQLQHVGRTTTLAKAASQSMAALLSAAEGEHPWTGWSFSAGWGSRETLDVTLVRPGLVVEVGVDVARDGAGRGRHPTRLHRPRPEESPGEVDPFGT